MTDNTDSQERSGDRHQAVNAPLTPEVRKILADLALMSERHVELSDALAQASLLVSSLVERHPHLASVSSELHVKTTQLLDLHRKLGHEVMRYSHAYEDVTMAGAKLNKE